MKLSLPVAFLAALALSVDGVRAEGDSGSTVIYVVIAIVVLLFIAAAIFVWMRSRRRNKDRDLPMHEPNPLPAPQSRQTGGRNGPPSAVSHPSAQPHREQPREQRPTQPAAAPNSNYRGYSSPAGRQDPRNQNQNANNGSQPSYQEPQRPPRQPQSQQREHGHANPNGRAQPRRPSHPPSSAQKPGAPGHGGKGKERPQRANETAARVLAEFQSDPALCRRKIPYAALYFTRVLSKGAFGEVWLAQLENRQVAVKRILNEKKNDEKEIECFAAEIKLMASFYHPKIVEFVGVSWSTLQDLCAVTEYMAKGDLYGFLKRKNGQLNWRDHKIYLAEDVADALGYLHSLSPKVIHRDLKSKNILLDDSFRAKLSDFGISRERSLEETMTAGVGTIYWTAPEVLMGKKYTEKADIYSFGIVMSELDTHEVPYSDLRDEAGKKLQGMKIVQQVIKKKMRPTFSGNCPSKVSELAARCLDAEPDVRPDAIELLHLIQRIQQQL